MKNASKSRYFKLYLSSSWAHECRPSLVVLSLWLFTLNVFEFFLHMLVWCSILVSAMCRWLPGKTCLRNSPSRTQKPNYSYSHVGFVQLPSVITEYNWSTLTAWDVICCVSASRGFAVQTRLNGFRSCLGWRLENPRNRLESQFPPRKRCSLFQITLATYSHSYSSVLSAVWCLWS